MSAPAAYRPIVCDLAQGSEDWLRWREKGLGSSDAAAIMGVSPWTTALQLWEQKTERRPATAQNAAMRRGTDLEVFARREFEFEQGGDFKPACLVHAEHPFLKASLDGLSEDGKTVLEIKAPGAKAHAIAMAGSVPEYYRPQIDHLLLVSGAERCMYWSYTPEAGGVLVTVERDEPALALLLEREIAFWQCVQDDTPPAESALDVIQRDDDEWDAAARDYRLAYAAMADAESDLKHAREALLTLAGGRRCEGFGVKVTPFERQGAVDYKAAGRELADILGEEVQWDKWRKPGTTEVRVTVDRGDA